MSDLRDLIDASGRPVALGREIAAGGEGVVYAVAGDDASVVKVYRRPPSESTVAKLRWMVAHATERLAAVAAWPTDLLFDRATRRLVGFRMADLSAFEPIHHLYNPAVRVRYFPRATWAFLARAARNLAAAFDEVHQAGVVLGDVNPTNARVCGQALVRLIDCDSFQVTADGQVYPCEVGVAHYTPPELQGVHLRGVARTADHDRFGLAVLIFQLLMVGRHPFAGVEAGETSAEEAIARHRFAYGRLALGLAPPPFTLGLADLPPAVAELFGRAFEPGAELAGRPDASEWCAALDELGQALVLCHRAGGHHFWHVGGTCPWCRIVNDGGPDYFFGASESARTLTDEARHAILERDLATIGPYLFSYSRDGFGPRHPPSGRPVVPKSDLGDVLSKVAIAMGATMLALPLLAGTLLCPLFLVPLALVVYVAWGMLRANVGAAIEEEAVQRTDEHDDAEAYLERLEASYAALRAEAEEEQGDLVSRARSLLGTCHRPSQVIDPAENREARRASLARAEELIRRLQALQTQLAREIAQREEELRVAVARVSQARADLEELRRLAS